MLAQHYNVISVKLEGTFGEMWPSNSMMTLDMQLGEGVSMHCEMYSLLLHYKTRQRMFIYSYFKDNTIYGSPFISYVYIT